MVNFSKHDNNGHVLVSYYVSGKRTRKTFPTSRLADEFIKEMRAGFEREEAKEVLGIKQKSFALGPMLISDAIKHELKYLELKIKDRENFKCNRHGFQYFHKWFFDHNIDHLHEIKLTHLQSIQFEWAQGGLKWSSINRRFASLKAFLNRCVDWEFIEESPARRLKGLSGETPEKRHWTESEIKLVLENLSLEAQAFFVALYQSGTRPKDLANVRWPDVDLEKGTIQISSRKGKGSIVRKHEIVLTEDQVRFYQNLKKIAVDKQGFVFLNPSGGKVTTNWFTGRVRVAKEKAKVRKDLVPYALRGMLFSLIAEMDVSPSKLRKIAGHAKSETTMKYYIQHDLEGLRNVVSMAEARRKMGEGKREKILKQS